MNETSSRSHAVFTLVLSQRRKDEQTGLEAEKVSRISLVDLAGSERANSTGATGSRLKEGANINRSLTSLGKVIAALAQASMDASKTPNSKKKVSVAAEHVPYRDSVLTWLLKDSLGGNSKTAMIAAISPADYEETLSTLRYADQAKKIKNKAVVNEDPNAKLIRELKEELDMLRSRAQGGDDTWDPSIPPEKQLVRYMTKSGEMKTMTKAVLQEQMEQNEKLTRSLNESWEEKLSKTQAIQIEREKALEELGITIDKGNVGVHTPKNLPHLVNLNEDALMNECLLYQLKPGKTVVGNLETNQAAQIRLSGHKILHDHCWFENTDGVVTIHAHENSMTMVNGKRITADQPKRLRSGYRVILGDFHVFRVNNPGEVRKARDRVKSAMSGTSEDVSTSLLRPDSPVSEDGQDVDWMYARREAIMGHLNGQEVGLDHLSNEDLDRLFQDISRVRSKKGGRGGTPLSRPDSRISSSIDDSESRDSSSLAHLHSLSGYTDDTSLDPWSQRDDDSITSRPPEAQASTPDANVSTDDATVTSAETALLRATIKKYEERFQKQLLEDDDQGLSEEQRSLALKTVARWRSRTHVSMAEDVLTNAVRLKEANVISKDLGKQTTYQFVVVDAAPLSNPTSTIEAIAGLTEYDDVADVDLVTGPKPCVAVKVVDVVHQSIYVWSLAKLSQRLHKMRNLYTFIDKPEYSQHFNWADPFYESPAPTYSFVGAVLVSLLPLTRRQSAKYPRVPIVSPESNAVVGTANVEIKFVSLTAPPKSSPGEESSVGLIVGHKLGVQITVDGVEGLSAEDIRECHLQLRLSSIAGTSIKKDDSFASAPVTDLASLKLRKTVAVVLTPAIVEHLNTGLASIEFHGKVSEAYLRRSLQRDLDRASGTRVVNGQIESSVARPEFTRHPTSQGRFAETELLNESRHDLLASLELCELDASGEYRPVSVRSTGALDPGIFLLRQGLQRKLVIHLSHDSGKQFDWKRITKVEIGSIRLLDAKNKVHDATKSDPVRLNLPLRQQSVSFKANGTSELEAWTWWDTSIHDCIMLNRVTVPDQRVLLRLNFEVEVEGCVSPASFGMDFAISIKARDAKPPGRIMSLIESATTTVRTLPRMSAVFAVRLRPPEATRAKELWRLDTAEKYVRGQEALTDWRPLGVTFLQEHERFMKKHRRLAEAESWRVVLQQQQNSSAQVNGSKLTNGSSHDHSAVIARSLALWQAATWEAKARTPLSPEVKEEVAQPVEDAIPTSPAPTPSTTISNLPPRLTASVELLPRSDQVARKGYLSMPLETFTDTWTRRFFTLKRPHLFVYPHSSECQELLVIHLASVRVGHDPNVEEMLGKENVFGLYTATNSYFFQASSREDMQGWIGALHPSGKK